MSLSLAAVRFWLRRPEPGGGSAQDARVTGSRQGSRGILFAWRKSDSALSNEILPAIELMFAAARLHDREEAAEVGAKLRQIQQNQVVHHRTHREVRHIRRQAKEFRVFVVEEGGHEPKLAVGHQRVKKVPVQQFTAGGGAVAGQAIDHQALNILLLDGADNVREVCVDVQLLRTLKQDVERSGVEARPYVQAQGLGVSNDLRGVFVERNQQPANPLLNGSFEENLAAEDGFSHAGNTHDHGCRSIEQAAP